MVSRALRPSQLAIGKAAGVSRATVSAVLRGQPGLTAETVERVRAVADKMGYRPNALVAGIKSGKSRSIGVFVHPYDSFWTEVLNGITDRLTEAEHACLLMLDQTHRLGHDPSYGLSQVHRALDRRADAVIFWPYFASLYAGHLEEFSSRNVPIVTIDHALPATMRADEVETDETAIASALAGHITGLGHRRLLVIGGPDQVGWADERVAALETALRGTSTEQLDVIRIGPSDNAVAAVRERLSRPVAERPSAILATTDHYAADVYRAAYELGVRIPDELSVIGVADLNFAALLNPGLTTVRQNGYEVGRLAANLALERSAGLLIGAPRRVRTQPELILRGSTAAPA